MHKPCSSLVDVAFVRLNPEPYTLVLASDIKAVIVEVDSAYDDGNTCPCWETWFYVNILLSHRYPWY